MSTNPNKSNASTTSKTSKKPISLGSEKATAAKEEQSRRIYVESQAAKAPPKQAYKTPEGKTVNVRTDSAVTQNIRTKPSSYYQPEVREQRTVEHIRHYHYSQPSSWYYSQPSVYVGGGYSSAFWWMMSEWSAERRAQWFYHNQNVIERDAYERGLRDSAVAARVAELQRQNLHPNPDYVDPEFSNDPSMMYTQDHIEAAYNPEVVASSNDSGVALTIFFGVVIVWMLLILGYVVFFKVRWGK